MKIVFLNIWKGVMFGSLMDFLKHTAHDTDFFCLMEVTDSPRALTTLIGGRTNMFSEISAALPGFKGYYARACKGFDEGSMIDFELFQGQAIFARNRMSIDSSGEVFLYGDKDMTPRYESDWNPPTILQYVRFSTEDGRYTLASMHGMAYPGSKLDTPDRLEQSRKLLSFLADEEGEKIVGGDFNLLPEAESVGMIEKAGMRNMIKEFNIPSTRNELAYGSYPEAERQYFADYAFISPGVRVVDFQVPYLSVSDHLPLMLEFL